MAVTHVADSPASAAPGGAEAHSHEELFDRFRDRLPKEFIFERELLRSRLWRSPERWELAHE
jgi:phosphoenolpyruvate carboxykinase (GTP)